MLIKKENINMINKVDKSNENNESSFEFIENKINFNMLTLIKRKMESISSILDKHNYNLLYVLNNPLARCLASTMHLQKNNA